MFAVTILGNNSALPAYDRHPSAQIVTINDQLLLIDCGEGTQMQLSRYKIRRGKLNHIFISHLHGDHYFGLIGLISSMALLNREQPLHLFAPPGLEEIISLQLKVASTTLPYELVFHPLNDEEVILDTPKFSVEAFHTQHRIPCWGFLIKEKKHPRKLDKEKAINFDIPAAFYPSLKMGYDYTAKDGSVVYNEQVTIPNSPAKSYAYCADTIYDERLINIAKDVTMIYHEATYLNGMEERAAARFHSTTSQAATIAMNANAGGLLLGHFSSKFEELHDYLKEALEVFPKTQLAIEGVTFRI
ncbi:MAG TPA: ribonuclease Z [Sediminibacterium sp.]|jgi:ribonuclease Z|uniref:ribonuclease Z n=1 Tax=Sediminibacterium sp. TaxID=1917865 RepID=UPI0008C6E1BB|nr:ribonuclease Z [Sediminibacterium sp.]OHC89450.1 MAG: ribonuclease Z [Sphingobacteriia bacterium RIFOXYD2_FULL_35_12]OYY08326.1 MAG: ribonuclease Z [Sphingobacteriia bacterium 35-36-14]OYZ53543.1 MAG: ribonuclease Z [Sphingobacteriia bacterium 24-36-13]OZA65782.1 MAG: ribonuclease Z [Sphingobacteriia bacterium 39-36-14]MBT9483192.1 ribonuclease Z [Sediminibacterium sp.]